MLKSLKFENFKSWGGPHHLDFGRITGLFGANSSGKSSIIHLLLLLKQTVESPDSSLILQFGGGANGYVDLGSFADIVNNHDISKSISYTLEWHPGIETSFHSNFSVGDIVASNTIIAVPGIKGEEVINSQLDYSINCYYNDPNLPDSIDGFSGKMTVKSMRSSSGSYLMALEFEGEDVFYSSDSEDSDAPIGLYRFTRRSIEDLAQRFDLYLDILDASTPHLTTYPPPSYPDLIKMDNSSYFELCESYGIDLTRIVNVDYDVSRLLTQMGDVTEQCLRKIVHLGPLRDHPLRTYPWTGATPATVGNRGEQAIQVLLGEKSTSVNAVSMWLQRLGLAESMTLRRVGRGARTWEPIIKHHDGATEDNLADVGFGVSQVLPVIVALLSAPAGSLVILEHPELHLHPSAQGELADLLIEVASAGEIQILVESHSEHLLARIQRRIAESARDDGDLTPEDVRLYFCKQKKGKSELEPLKIQPSGLITNWPDDFFGDILEERMALGGFSLDVEDQT